MANVFLATLGQRPEAITVALDLLLDRYPIESVVVLHTDAEASGIANALADLRPVLEHDYRHREPQFSVRYIEFASTNGMPLVDITDYDSAMAYYGGVYKSLLEYRERGDLLHLLVSGGRKAMSIYATLAAAMIFSEYDFLWTVLSPSVMVEKPGQFHIPVGLRDQVHLVKMPIVNARLPVGALSHDLLDTPISMLEQMSSRRQEFLEKLTPRERTIADTFQNNPDATAEDIAQILLVSRKTVETHLDHIYGKMVAYLTFGETIKHKRQTLLDLISGRL